MNPLTTGEVFDIEFLNPNPSFSKTEKGPVYRVSFEIPKDVWDEFVEANTKGMILAARCRAVEPKGEPPKTTVKLTGKLAKPPKEPTGQNCRRAIGLSNNPDFHNWVVKQFPLMGEKYTADRKGAEAFFRDRFGIASKRELDDKPTEKQDFEMWYSTAPWKQS